MKEGSRGEFALAEVGQVSRWVWKGVMTGISDKAREFFEGRLASVNKSLVLPKVLYFLHYGAISWFVPFLGIYLRTAGLGDGEIGVLYAVICPSLDELH